MKRARRKESVRHVSVGSGLFVNGLDFPGQNLQAMGLGPTKPLAGPNNMLILTEQTPSSRRTLFQA